MMAVNRSKVSKKSGRGDCLFMRVHLSPQGGREVIFGPNADSWSSAILLLTSVVRKESRRERIEVFLIV